MGHFLFMSIKFEPCQKIVLEPLAKYWKAMIDEDHVVTINDVNQIVTADAIKDGLINAVNYYQKFNFYTKANAPSLSDSAHYTDWVINGIHDTKGEFIVAVLFNVKDVSLAGYNGTTNQKMTNMAPQDISGKWNFRLAYQDSKWMITQIVTPEKPKK